MKSNSNRLGSDQHGKYRKVLGGIIGGVMALASSLAAAKIQSWNIKGMIQIYAENSTLDTAKRADCVISSNNGADSRPSRWAWGDGSAGQWFCGFPDAATAVANGQGAWKAHTLRFTDLGPFFYILELQLPNEKVGRCLTSDSGGDTSIPGLERKNGTDPMKDPADGTVCGWSAAEIYGDLRLVWDWDLSLRSYKTNKCLIFGNNGDDTYASLYRWSGSDDMFCGLDLDGIKKGQAAFMFQPLFTIGADDM